MQEQGISQMIRIINQPFFPSQLLKEMRKIDNTYRAAFLYDRHARIMNVYGFWIKQWRIYTLEINGSYQSITRAIKDINFPDLKQLYLSDNNIISCQGLSRLEAPNLQTLSLSKNCLTQISSLRKMMPLTYLFIHDNFFREFDSLTQHDSKKIQQISIESKFTKKQCENINFCIKFEHRNKNLNFFIASYDRIAQVPIYSSLQAKYRKQKLILQKFDHNFP